MIEQALFGIQLLFGIGIGIHLGLCTLAQLMRAEYIEKSLEESGEVEGAGRYGQG